MSVQHTCTCTCWPKTAQHWCGFCRDWFIFVMVDLFLPWAICNCREPFDIAVMNFELSCLVLFLVWMFGFCSKQFGFAILLWQLWATVIKTSCPLYSWVLSPLSHPTVQLISKINICFSFPLWCWRSYVCYLFCRNSHNSCARCCFNCCPRFSSQDFHWRIAELFKWRSGKACWINRKGVSWTCSVSPMVTLKIWLNIMISEMLFHH